MMQQIQSNEEEGEILFHSVSCKMEFDCGEKETNNVNEKA